jgi:hypothetical protein
MGGRVVAVELPTHPDEQLAWCRDEVVPALVRATIAYRDLGPYLRTLLDEAVEQARGEGASWDDIAQALGMTRQAAWERWR